MVQPYTRYPRTVLWLVAAGRLPIGGSEAGARPQLAVDVEPFYISQSPITNREFEAFEPGFTRAATSSGDEAIATGVSFRQAAAYCRWYGSLTKKPMRLPTEIEWELACRAGSRDRYFWGGDAVEAEAYIWDCRNSGGRLPDVRSKKSNGFGLYGMLGGAWEWTSSPDGVPAPPADGGGSDAAEARCVLRGGSFRIDRSRISCSVRRLADPDCRDDDIGFRVARSLRS